MLVLTRRSGQTIRIGDSVTITVIELGRGRVRIGVEAPGEIPVHRAEIYQRIQAALMRATDSSATDATCGV